MNELLEITEILGDKYVSDRSKWQVLKAERIGHCEGEPDGWQLIIKKISEDKGAKNARNK